MDNFKILLEALIDKSSLTSAQKQLAKERLKINVDVDTTSAQKSTKKLVTDLQKVNQIKTIENWVSGNTRALKNFGSEINDIINRLSSIDDLTKDDFNNLKKQFSEIQVKARQTGKLGLSFGDKISQMREKFGVWTSVSSLMMKVLYEVKNGFKFIGELDDALTDVVYTSDITKSQLKDLGNSAIDMADDLNTSATNILEAVKIYSTANSTAEDIMRKSKPAIMLSNVSGMSGSESAKTINTSINQFELEDTEENLLDIVDTLEYVSSQLNYDFTEGMKEITEGIEASGNVAKNAGLNMQEYATMVGLAVERTGQSGSTIGNAYKTIFSRITKASSTEGTLEEDISAAEKSLRSIGVEVRDTDDEFRDLTETMADIGKVWDSLSSVEKSNVGFQVAGTRQLNVLNSLFGAWESYEDIMGDIDERSGMAMKNQEEYADSLKGHLGDLEATGQSIWNNILDSEALKGGIDLINTFAKGIEFLTDKIGVFSTLSIGGGLFAGFKNAGKENYISNLQTLSIV